MQTRLTLTSNELTDLVVQVRASFTYENLLRGLDAYKRHAYTAKKYSRLRLFQEELKKGKLVF